MANKDLGSMVTYLDPDKKALENVVYRQDRPHSHSEANLVQDVQNEARTGLLKGLMPSGFLTGDFYEDSLSNFVMGTTANTFSFNGFPTAHVNGWVVPITLTGTTTEGENLITLPAPPVNPGTMGVDFVYLEVWRALIDPDPGTANKPASDKIYAYGNVLSPSATWLDDDLKDTPVAIANPGIETTRRVQIQYAIRQVRLQSNSTRLGYDDVNIIAQGPNGSGVAGASYTKSLRDVGLHIAGDEIGQPGAIPGTVDGFVYSIPIGMVFRRNSSGFNYLSNGNGGAAGVEGVTASDRPDGFYSDQIVQYDIQDMRASVGPTSVDWERAMEKSFSLLLDNQLKSWVGQSSFTDFYVGGNNDSFGTKYLKADDLLPSTSADKPSGNTFRNPDGICTVFSDRAHVQYHTVEYDAATHSGGGTWVQGDTITLDFVSTNIEDEQPPGTFIQDVTSVRLNVASSGGVPSFENYSVVGLGTSQVVITLDTPPAAGSSADVWVEFEISYPSGSGLTSLVSEEVDNFGILVHNPSSFNSLFTTNFTDDAAGRSALLPFLTLNYEQGPHREVELRYRPDTNRTLNTFNVTLDQILLPEVPYVADVNDPDASFTVTVNGSSRNVTSISADLKTLTFTPAEASGGLAATVEFTPNRPFPINSVEATLYYLAPAIQAIPFEFLDNPADLVNKSLELEPLFVSDKVYSGTVSSGSVVTPFPYEGALNQIPVSALAGSAYQSEGELNAPGPISVDDFDADVGMLVLHAFVPMALTDSLVLQNPIDVQGSQSLEFIDHYLATSEGAYIPTAIAQPLSIPVEHKAFFPMIARVKRDCDFGPKGSVVLVVFSQYYDYSTLLPEGTQVDHNRVSLTSEMSCASIYRLKSNPLTHV
jgi:hypothetical protein